MWICIDLASWFRIRFEFYILDLDPGVLKLAPKNVIVAIVVTFVTMADSIRIWPIVVLLYSFEVLSNKFNYIYCSTRYY